MRFAGALVAITNLMVPLPGCAGNSHLADFWLGTAQLQRSHAVVRPASVAKAEHGAGHSGGMCARLSEQAEVHQREPPQLSGPQLESRLQGQAGWAWPAARACAARDPLRTI